MLRISLPLAVLVLIETWSRAASACSCMAPPPPAQAAADAAAVFEGRVVEVSSSDAPQAQQGQGVGNVEVTFEVARVWKGEVGPTLKLRTPDNSAACGREFQEGSTYLVYARSEENTFTDNLCSRTMPMDQAQADAEALGPSHAPGQSTPTETPTQEPPRVDGNEGPPPAEPGKRGCSIGEDPHAGFGAWCLVLLGAGVATRRRRNVR